MADHSPAEDVTDDMRSTPEGAGESLDLTLLLAVHHGLRRDLRRFVDRVDCTPVTERDSWQALSTRWELFAALVHHCFRWERLHLWPLVAAAAERGSRGQVEWTLALTQSRVATIEAMVESSRAVFERLARARDEDAVATLRARVRAACLALEESLDSEEDDVIPLLRSHVASRAWQEGQHRLFETDSGEELDQRLPWLFHELPLETAAVIAAGWSDRLNQELSASTEAFHELEGKAFGGAPTVLP